MDVEETLLMNFLDPGIELADWAMGWQPAQERYNTTVSNLFSRLLDENYDR
jgi:hypothetical protein